MTQATGVERLVGREEPLSAIDGFVERAAHGSAALLVEGEAGIGKTTLWSAGVEHARRLGFRVLVASPAEAEQALAFTALSDLLADVHDAITRLPAPQRRPLRTALLLEEATGPAVEPRAIAVGVLSLLRELAQHRPVLIAVDDVQWVDAASAGVLSFALRRTPGTAIGFLGAERSGTDISGTLALDGAERIQVAPLSLGALRRLIEDRIDAPFPRPILRRIHDRSGGNPFFALELARALQARGTDLSPHEELPVPNDLRRLLEARLRTLPPELMEPLAAVAALAEPTFELVQEDDLEPALREGVVLYEGNRLRFEHPLVASAAYARLTPRRQRALHGRLARIVPDFEERARHLALAADGPDSGVAALLDEASVRARARGAPQAAAEVAALALRLTEPDDRRARVLRTVAAAELNAVAGDLEEARRLVDDTLVAEPSGPDRARLLAQRARLGDTPVDAALKRLEQARAQAAGDAALEAEILNDLAYWLITALRLSAAEPYAQRALELAEEAGDAPLIVRALEMLATSQFYLGRGLRLDLLERAVELDPLCESERISVRPMAPFGHMCVWARELGRARALLERARRIGLEREDSSVYSVLGHSAALEYLDDNWTRSSEMIDELYELVAETGHEQGLIYALSAQALLFASLGDADRTRRCVAEARLLDDRHGTGLALTVAAPALGLLELSLDNAVGALEHLRPATIAAREAGIQEPGLVYWFPLHADAAVAAHELDEAEELLDWLEDHAVRVDRAWALACCARGRGLVAAARGEEAAAVAAFERALEEHGRVEGHRFELGRTRLAHGETLRRFKKKRGARDAIEAAIAIFDELGAGLWSANARRELARIGGRTGSGDELTASERRVAELVAAGKTNKEVAAELFVTPRTVETHLTKVYAKLGVRSRTELAARLSS